MSQRLRASTKLQWPESTGSATSHALSQAAQCIASTQNTHPSASSEWDDLWSTSHNPVQPTECSTQASKKNVTYNIIQMDSFARLCLLTNSTSATVDCAHVLHKTVSLEMVSIFFPSNIVIQKAISFLKSPGSSSFLPRSTAWAWIHDTICF